MPMCEIKDHKTGETLKAYDFGGPEIYYAGTSLVYAPLGGTSVSSFEKVATLNPLGITSVMKPRWEVTGHVGIGTADWRVSVVDTSTGETKDGVYPFNLQGNVYELECQPGTWVIASCGGYKIESSWSGRQSDEAFRLKGTGEIIKIFVPSFSLNNELNTYCVGARLLVATERWEYLSPGVYGWKTHWGYVQVGLKGNIDNNGSSDWYLEYFEGGSYPYNGEPVQAKIENYWYGHSSNFPNGYSYKGYNVPGSQNVPFEIYRYTSGSNPVGHYFNVNIPSVASQAEEIFEMLKSICIDTYGLTNKNIVVKSKYGQYSNGEPAYSYRCLYSISSLSTGLTAGYDYVNYKTFTTSHKSLYPKNQATNTFLNTLDASAIKALMEL